MAPVVALEVENISLNDKEEKKDVEGDEKQKEVEAVSKPTIGIIYPPPEVRSILYCMKITYKFVIFCRCKGLHTFCKPLP